MTRRGPRSGIEQGPDLRVLVAGAEEPEAAWALLTRSTPCLYLVWKAARSPERRAASASLKAWAAWARRAATSGDAPPPGVTAGGVSPFAGCFSWVGGASPNT